MDSDESGGSGGPHLNTRAGCAERSEAHVRQVIDQVGSDSVPLAVSPNTEQAVGHQIEVVIEVHISGHSVEQIDGYSGTTVHFVSDSFHSTSFGPKVGEYSDQVVARIGSYLSIG